MHSLVVHVKEGLAFAWNSSLENSEYPYLCFQLALFCSVFYFYSIYWSMALRFCSILDAISSGIDEILSVNLSANVCLWRNVHHNDSLTFSDGTDRLYLFCRGSLLIRKLWSKFLAQFSLAFLQIQKECSVLLYRWW